MEKQRFFRSQMLFWGNRSLFRAYWCEITETIIIMFSLYYLMTVFMSVNIIYFNLLPTCIFISYFLCSFKFRQKKLTWTYSIDAIVLCYRYKLKQVYIINGNISKITWSPHTLKYNTEITTVGIGTSNVPMLYITHSILSKNGQEMKIINRFASD